MDARLAFYFKEDPEEWDDDKWASKWAQLKYLDSKGLLKKYGD